jgi:uncharacterized protein YutE (UPF0331/DUF86 family)
LVKKAIVAARLERLREYLKTLRAMEEFDLERFAADPYIHGAAERYLHLAIECLLDIGNHIIADRGFRKPETYGEVFEILAEESVISPELMRELVGMAAFRNVLVHDYLKLDLEKVHQVVRDKLKVFEALAGIYAGFL